MTLEKGGASPLPLQSDEVTLAETAEETSEKTGKTGKKAERKTGRSETKATDEAGSADDAEEVVVNVDFDGLADRVTRVPIEADNYIGLQALDGQLLYAKADAVYYGRESEAGPVLRLFSFDDRQETTLVESFESIAVSQDGSTALVGVEGGFQLLEISSAATTPAKPVSTSGLEVDRVPAEEWAQIFDEVWRRFRDYFYVANMHGYDWQALREQYRPLLAHVAHRSDLNYVMSEMIAELNVSHAYVSGGDYEVPERPRARCWARVSSSTWPAGATSSPTSSPGRTASRPIVRR
ncbi:MAG: hypothetical protein HC897_01835 [Thermoanaerobaculia bacterium]|nr:hypothetical protein [Thermoanaerobaculia bacterium]